MKFKVTVEQEGRIIDEQETDCVIGAMHQGVGDGEEYQNFFYADCDATTVVRVIKTIMRSLKEKMSDPDLAEGFLMDVAEPEDETGGGEIN